MYLVRLATIMYNPSYLGGKFNRRVDYLLQTLLKIEEDMFLTRQQKMLGLHS